MKKTSYWEETYSHLIEHNIQPKTLIPLTNLKPLSS